DARRATILRPLQRNIRRTHRVRLSHRGHCHVLLLSGALRGNVAALQRDNIRWFVYSGVFVAVAQGFMYAAVACTDHGRDTTAAVDFDFPAAVRKVAQSRA